MIFHKSSFFPMTSHLPTVITDQYNVVNFTRQMAAQVLSVRIILLKNS